MSKIEWGSGVNSAATLGGGDLGHYLSCDLMLPTSSFFRTYGDDVPVVTSLWQLYAAPPENSILQQVSFNLLCKIVNSMGDCYELPQGFFKAFISKART